MRSLIKPLWVLYQDQSRIPSIPTVTISTERLIYLLLPGKQESKESFMPPVHLYMVMIPRFPKQKTKQGIPSHPMPSQKKTNELYARTFGQLYEMELIGLRYFNIFGLRQSPKGPYAAVIPLFLEAVLTGASPTINGDGSFSRDFTFVENAVLANKLALFTDNPHAINQEYNVACGKNTTLNELWEMMNRLAGKNLSANYGPERAGDIPHSLADISKAENLLGYHAKVSVEEGLKKLIEAAQT